MGRISKAYPHVLEEEVRARLKITKDRRTTLKLLAILNAMVDPRTAIGILHPGVSVHSVHNWIPAYYRSGMEGISDAGTGGRRNAHMTRNKESLFLRPFIERAAAGGINNGG
jgi:hypothetical protein